MIVNIMLKVKSRTHNDIMYTYISIRDTFAVNKIKL